MTVAATAAVATTACPRRQTTNGVKVFKRSGKGVHVSNAAKKHNANRLYKTLFAANSDSPHPGDNSYVVELIINRSLFNKLFANGRTIADFRLHL